MGASIRREGALMQEEEKIDLLLRAIERSIPASRVYRIFLRKKDLVTEPFRKIDLPADQ